MMEYDTRPVTDQATADASPEVSVRSRRARRGVALRRWAPVVLLVFVPVLLVSLHVHAYTKLSPIDELQHIDYMFRSPGIHPVIAGTNWSAPAMREEACPRPRPVYPHCRLAPPRTLDPASRTKGMTRPTSTPRPTTTSPGRRVRSSSTHRGKSWVTVWRLVGALWLAAGLVLTYAAGLRLGASPCLSSAFSPFWPRHHRSSSRFTVTPDAASTLWAAQCCISHARWEAGGSCAGIALIGIDTVGTAIKIKTASS